MTANVVGVTHFRLELPACPDKSGIYQASVPPALGTERPGLGIGAGGDKSPNYKV